MGDWGDDGWGDEPAKPTETNTSKPADNNDDPWGDVQPSGQSSSWGDDQKSGSGGWGSSNDRADDRGFRGRGSRGGGFRGRGDRGGGRGGRGGGFGRGGPRNDDDNGWGNTGGGSWGSSDRGGRGGRGGTYRDNHRRNDSGGGWGNSRDNGDSGWGSGGGQNDNSKKNDNDSGGWGSSDDWGNSGAKRSRNDDNQSGGGGGWGEDSKPANSGDGGSSWGDDRPNKRTRREDDMGDDPPNERPAPFKPEELNLAEEAKFEQTTVGENFDNYDQHKVTCVPADAITPIQNFEDVIKSKLLLANIEKRGFNKMTPIQKWAMPALIDGNDLIACAQTGSGKTAAFVLPILQTLLDMELDRNDPDSECQNPYCLIISPTRELANQLYKHTSFLCDDSLIKCVVIYGQIATSHLKNKLCEGCHILIATPGRLKDFVERGWIGFKNLRYLILDEGDRLVDDGFMTDIQNFFNHPTMPPMEKRQTLFFSATFNEKTQNAAKTFLKSNFIFLTVGKIGAANENIKQEFIKVSRNDKKRELKTILQSVPESEKVIVFTQTKQLADILAGFFSSMNLSSTSIHGDRLQSQREEAIRLFRRGDKRFLISSPVGNRGLDLPKVSLVINYDMPKCIDEYVHRIGRTGRAGHLGRAISFFDDSYDSELLPELIDMLKEVKQPIPDWMEGSGGGGAGGGGVGGFGDSDWDSAPKASANDDWDQPAGTTATTTSTADDDWDNPKPVVTGPKTPPIASNDDDWGEPIKTNDCDQDNKDKTNARQTTDKPDSNNKPDDATTANNDDGW